jgi:biopolymer transport protein ExbD
MGVKLPKGATSTKIPIDMTPMIDVVFQLLIFFMLTLKISADEGDFSINMPIEPAGQADNSVVPELKVRLTAKGDGTLESVVLNDQPLGTGEAAFEELNRRVLAAIGRPGGPLSKEIEAELDPDYELRYSEVVRAMTAVTGRLDPATKQVRRYVEKVKFARPRAPRTGG